VELIGPEKCRVTIRIETELLKIESLVYIHNEAPHIERCLRKVFLNYSGHE